eukprot:m.404098 g.404098  ORF g.404098 m.404098 type:complete len:932 (-) comp56473_c1_seq2:67-2862(-)
MNGTEGSTLVGSVPVFHVTDKPVTFVLLACAIVGLLSVLSCLVFLKQRRDKKALLAMQKALKAAHEAGLPDNNRYSMFFGDEFQENVLFAMRDAEVVSDPVLKRQSSDSWTFDFQRKSDEERQANTQNTEAPPTARNSKASILSSGVSKSSLSPLLEAPTRRQSELSTVQEGSKRASIRPFQPARSISSQNIVVGQPPVETFSPNPSYARARGESAQHVIPTPGQAAAKRVAGPPPARGVRQKVGAPDFGRSPSAVSLMITTQSKVDRKMSFPELKITLPEEPDVQAQTPRVSTMFKSELGDLLMNDRPKLVDASTVPHVKRQQIEIVDEIAQGQYGSISRAIFRNSRDATSYTVVKTLSLAASQQDRVNFFQESDMLCSLSHNNIIRCVGIVVDQQCDMIVFDYISEGSLMGFLQHSKLPVIKLLRIAHDLSSAVAYLSSKNIIHNDIRCRNVLINRTGGCKLSGFASPRSTSTKNANFRWKAPETWSDSNLSHASDIWALAVCFWEMFNSAVPPYGNFSHDAIQKYIGSGHRLSSGGKVPQALYVVMIHCWHPHPSARPSPSLLYDYIKTKIELTNTSPLCDECSPLQSIYEGSDLPNVGVVAQWIARGSPYCWSAIPSLQDLEESARVPSTNPLSEVLSKSSQAQAEKPQQQQEELYSIPQLQPQQQQQQQQQQQMFFQAPPPRDAEAEFSQITQALKSADFTSPAQARSQPQAQPQASNAFRSPSREIEASRAPPAPRQDLTLLSGTSNPYQGKTWVDGVELEVCVRRAVRTGPFGFGVASTWTANGRKNVISYVDPFGPAAHLLVVGDEIIAMTGEAVADLPLEDLKSMIRGLDLKFEAWIFRQANPASIQVVAQKPKKPQVKSKKAPSKCSESLWCQCETCIVKANKEADSQHQMALTIAKNASRNFYMNSSLSASRRYDASTDL